jgi:hypothetical protein
MRMGSRCAARCCRTLLCLPQEQAFTPCTFQIENVWKTWSWNTIVASVTDDAQLDWYQSLIDWPPVRSADAPPAVPPTGPVALHHVFLDKRVRGAWDVANRHLATRDFMLGDRPTIADIRQLCHDQVRDERRALKRLHQILEG